MGFRSGHLLVALVLAIVKCTHRGTMNGISSGREGRCSCGGVGAGGSCIFSIIFILGGF